MDEKEIHGRNNQRSDEKSGEKIYGKTRNADGIPDPDETSF